MPITTHAWMQLLHVIASALVLGSLATLPQFRYRLEAHEDSRVTLMGLRHIRHVERWLLIPGALAILAFGLLMVEGPSARFDFTGPGAGWLHAGATLWVLLAASIGAMWYAREELLVQARQGTTGGARVRRLWRVWMTGCLVGLSSTLAGVTTMLLRLGA